jgi:hypothetical protein
MLWGQKLSSYATLFMKNINNSLSIQCHGQKNSARIFLDFTVCCNVWHLYADKLRIWVIEALEYSVNIVTSCHQVLETGTQHFIS